MAYDKNDFSKGSVAGNIFRIALPLTVAQIVNVLYNIVDRAFIGHIPDIGSMALTGVGIAFPIISLITAFANLWGMGGSPLFSISRGEKDDKKASQIMGNAFFMLLITAAVVMVLLYSFSTPILYLLGASDKTVGYANDYMNIYLIGTFFSMITTGMNAFINAQGYGSVGMRTVLIGALCNIALDPIFIFVFGMGVKGAALATIISQLISAVWVMSFICSKKAVITLKVSDMKPVPSIIRRIASMGLSPFIMSVTTSATQSISNATLQSFGGDLYVGIMTVITSIREMFLLGSGGMTQGSIPVIGFNYGAKRYDRSRKAIKYMGIYCFIYTFISWIVLMVFPEFLISIFTDNVELISTGVDGFRVYFLVQFMITLQSVGQTSFLALGKSKQAIFFSLLRKAIIVIPLTLILPNLFSLKVYGVFLAEPVSDIIGGTACFSTFMFTVWPTLKQNPESEKD